MKIGCIPRCGWSAIICSAKCLCGGSHVDHVCVLCYFSFYCNPGAPLRVWQGMWCCSPQIAFYVMKITVAGSLLHLLTIRVYPDTRRVSYFFLSLVVHVFIPCFGLFCFLYQNLPEQSRYFPNGVNICCIPRCVLSAVICSARYLCGGSHVYYVCVLCFFFSSLGRPYEHVMVGCMQASDKAILLQLLLSRKDIKPKSIYSYVARDPDFKYRAPDLLSKIRTWLKAYFARTEDPGMADNRQALRSWLQALAFFRVCPLSFLVCTMVYVCAIHIVAFSRRTRGWRPRSWNATTNLKMCTKGSP